MSLKTFAALFMLLLLFACDRQATTDFMLEALDAEAHGIDFVNEIPENDSINILTFEYLYNGGGVGVGDFDKDGRPDLFFSGNLTSSRLYLQKEEWQFTDNTAAAGLNTTAWCAGVNVSDVDGNGWEDIYLSTLDVEGRPTSPNLLFLNQGTDEQGTPIFVESAAAAGLDDRSYGTHSAWFDLEGDGDQDLYVLNNSLEDYPRNFARGTDTTGQAKSIDRIYRNVTPSGGALRFELTSLVKAEGWGLGVAVQDFDRDGYADLYLANDFVSDDFLLKNEAGEVLRNEIQARIPHQSRNSMGVDVADLNNDGHPEIVVVDMLPDDNLRRKTMFGEIPNQRYREEVARGYNAQFVRNTLQLNNGDGTFSDIAFLAGMEATDWSWAPLLADFDNDGNRDIFISNGYPKDVTNKDFIDFSRNSSHFGTTESSLAVVQEALLGVSGVHQPNYHFRNDGDLNFTPVDWSPATPTYSNGAVPVDLDGDGDLDLVTNNINEPVGLYRNYRREREGPEAGFLTVVLEGPSENPHGLGARVYVRTPNGTTQFHEHRRQRGYLSSFGQEVHFGIGREQRVEQLTVVWPDGRVNELNDLEANQQLRIAHSTSLAYSDKLSTPPAAATQHADFYPPVRPALEPALLPGLPRHQESDYSDFDLYALALRDLSHNGPALASDGENTLFFGGAAGQPVTVHKLKGGALTQVQALVETTPHETTSLLLVDYDGDGDDDLFVGNGSSEFVGRDSLLEDQLYRNDDGHYQLTTGLLPTLSTPVVTATVVAGDLENDGDIDLFIGNRLVPGAYPRPPASYVLRNEGGRYVVAQELSTGMVTAASFTDFNGDGLADLALVGEYLSPTVYLNQAGILKARPTDPDLRGWWYSLTPNDLDGDGDTDLLAGNYGRNGPYRATPDQPLTLRADDYDQNGALDPIVTAYNGGKAYPVHPRNTIARQLPSLKRQLQNYATYGGWSEEDLPPLTETGIRLEATELRSAWLENDGSGSFSPRFLPNAGQTAPLRAAVVAPLADGSRGMLVVQNDYATEKLGGPLDAGTGFALRLDAAGKPEILPGYWSVREDARSLVPLAGGRYLVGLNDGEVRVYVASGQALEQ